MTGNWRAGSTSIDVAVESWGGDCGPRPTSSRSGGGGVVTIEQREQALLLHGRDQDIRTDACWSRNPAMKRTLASYSNGQWLTKCRTADDDPRAEQGTYTLKLQDQDTLLYKDVSRYDWSLNDSKCVATFSTTQTLTRAANATVNKAAAGKDKEASPAPAKDTRSEPPASTRNEEPAAKPEPEEAASARGCRPGAPARITLKPKRAEIEVGQRTCFKVKVTDAADCNIPAANVTFLLSHSKALKGAFVGGCFVAAEGAAEGAGEFKVIAKVGALQTDATVLVQRVDLSSLIARRMEGAGLTGMEEAPVAEAAPKAVARIATHTAPVEQSSTQSALLVALGLLALTLTAVGFWVSRRRPAVAAAADGGDDDDVASMSLSDVRTYDRPNTRGSERAPEPGASVSPASPSQRPDLGPGEPWICPTCRVGYPAQQTTCPKDGTALIPYAEFTQRRKRAEQEHEKRCPKCGKTYPQSASFCGEDGSSLVEAGV